MERVKMVDLMDGKEDGEASKTVSKCSRCVRPMNARHKKCIYCGHAKLIDDLCLGKASLFADAG